MCAVLMDHGHNSQQTNYKQEHGKQGMFLLRGVALIVAKIMPQNNSENLLV